MENQEINLEKVHRLLDSLQVQAQDRHVADMLSTAQLLVAELQHIHLKNNSGVLKNVNVSVVMPFAGKPVVSHVPLEAPDAPIAASLSEESPVLQPPTIIKEAEATAATDTHSFGKISESRQPAPPIQKELFTLEEEPEEDQIHISALTPDQYPTSIPSDNPILQEPTQGQVTNEPSNAEIENKAVVTPPIQQAPDFEGVPETMEAHAPMAPQMETQNSASTSMQPPVANIEQTEADKRKHLAFIHDNFSAWADYGATDAPTLVQNRPLTQAGNNSYNSSYEQQPFKELNEQLSQPQEEWAHKMQSTPIDNLASAIGINDRYLYISELFRGDESMYERSIITLNKFNSFPEAHAWSERELRLKLGWDTQNPITQQFEQLIKRRFMNS